MMQVKEALKRTALGSLVSQIRQRKAVDAWRRAGSPNPPPALVKQQTVAEYARRFGPPTLVETGTYLGDMVHASRRLFRRIYSIELDRALCERGRRRFACAGHVTILEGDSARVLPEVLKEIREPCLFWLDGHYSEGVTARADRDTPVEDELRHIFQHEVRDHVILIDDAHCFNGQNDYPALSRIAEIVRRERPGWNVEVKDDVIRIHPPASPAHGVAADAKSDGRQLGA